MKPTAVKDHQVCEWQQQWHYDHVATWCQGDLLLWDVNAMKIIWLPWRGRLILHLRRTKSHYKPFLFNFPLEIDVLEHFYTLRYAHDPIVSEFLVTSDERWTKVKQRPLPLTSKRPCKVEASATLSRLSARCDLVSRVGESTVLRWRSNTSYHFANVASDFREIFAHSVLYHV